MQPSVARSATAEDAFFEALLVLGRRMRQRLPGDELDYSLVPALRVLWESGPVRHTELAERLLLDASTVSRKVHQLEERGLVTVTPDTHDARARRVTLLPEGHAVLEQLLARRRSIITCVLETWPAEDRTRLHELLDRFNNDLHEHDEATT